MISPEHSGPWLEDNGDDGSGMTADCVGMKRGQFLDVYRACCRWERERGLAPANPLKAKQEFYYAAQHNTKNTKTN